MSVTNVDGTATFDLEILRYQFPELEHSDWDSNWLVVSGKVVAPARSWEFLDPCLLTMEAHDLANWLADLVADKQTETRIFFTEPNLSFEVVAADSEIIELRLYFALESLPPNVQAASDEFSEQFRVSRSGLKEAANDLCRSLQRFPVRSGSYQWAPPCREL